MIAKGPQAFPRAEHLRRLEAVKAEMSRAGMDTLLVFSEANITYLAGGFICRNPHPKVLVISLRDEEPAYILRGMDVTAAMHVTFLSRENIIGYPDDLIGRADRDGFDKVLDFLHDSDLAKGRIGLELSHIPPGTSEKFKSRLHGVTFIDGTKLVTRLRSIKSDLEIEVMREAAAIADAGIMRATDVIRPGVREPDAVAEIMATLVRGVNGKPGTIVPSILLCSSPRTGTAHIPWSDDVFRDGSQVNLELGGNRHGYSVGLMRTFIIGPPSDRLKRLHEAELAGLEAALETVGPGRTCGEVADAFYTTIGRHGFSKASRCGYPIGIDWNETTSSLQSGDITELKTNMTFHLMLGNWLEEDFGYVLSETFLVTDDGAEVLTHAPRQLFQL